MFERPGCTLAMSLSAAVTPGGIDQFNAVDSRYVGDIVRFFIHQSETQAIDTRAVAVFAVLNIQPGDFVGNGIAHSGRYTYGEGKEQNPWFHCSAPSV
jgi:hypothetical protein